MTTSDDRFGVDHREVDHLGVDPLGDDHLGVVSSLAIYYAAVHAIECRDYVDVLSNDLDPDRRSTLMRVAIDFVNVFALAPLYRASNYKI